MTEPEKISTERSWLDRLSHALLREPQDREQLVSLLRDAEQRSLLDAQSLSMIEGVLQMSEMQVRDIMIPRAQVTVVSEQESVESFLPIIVESGHSRFPVMNANRDEVIGILMAKDLLVLSLKTTTDFTLRDYLRPAVFVPESKHLDVLLREFRDNRNHMAIVVDEYGSVSGVITIEDVIEQIVGEIEDEYDVDEETNIKKQSETEYTLKALTPIEEFNEYFETHFSENEFDTIGGLITSHFGHVPQRGEKLSLKNFEFKVVLADTRQVRLFRLTACSPEAD